MTNSTTATHATAPTRFVTAADAEFAYRRFGPPGPTPLLMLQFFRGNLDSWDPALTDALAAEREVILVDYPGVGSSTGLPASTVAVSAGQILAFLDALGESEVDLFGYSLGGFVAQEIVAHRPGAVRRLVLAGTGPRGAANMPPFGWADGVAEHALADRLGAADLLYLFFPHDDAGKAVGVEFLQRMTARAENRAPAAGPAARDAQYAAIRDWGTTDFAALARLEGIDVPTLVLVGDHDLLIPASAGHLLAGLIPEARLVGYPGTAHGFPFQEAVRVAADVGHFLR